MPSRLQEQRRAAHRRRVEIACVAGIVLIAWGVRVYDLGGKDLWLDEANSVIIAQEDFSGLIERLKADSSPPAYYLLLHFWIRTFGDSVVAVRSLSVLFGACLVVGVFLFAKRFLSLQVAVMASVLACLSPIQVLWSQQARMYTLLPLLSLVSMWFLWKAVFEGTSRSLAGYILTTLLCLYTHNYGFYLLPAHFLFLVGSGALRARPGRWAICGIGLVAGYAFWMPAVLVQLVNKGHYSWFVPIWEDWGILGSLRQTLKAFTPGLGAPFILPGVETFRWVPLVLAMALAGLGTTAIFAGKGERPSGGNGVGMVVLCLVAPLAFGLVGSLFMTPHYVPGRVDQICFPCFVLLVSIGLSFLKPAVLRNAMFVILIGFSVVGLEYHYGNKKPDGEKAIAEAILRHSVPGDAVVCTSLTRASIQYYLGRAGAQVTLFSYPGGTERHLGSQDNRSLLQQPEELKKEARSLLQNVEEVCGHEARMFVVFVPDRVNEILGRALSDPSQITLLRELGRFETSVKTEGVILSLRQLAAPQGRTRIP